MGVDLNLSLKPSRKLLMNAMVKELLSYMSTMEYVSVSYANFVNRRLDWMGRFFINDSRHL